MRNNKSIRRGLKEKIIALAEQGLNYDQIKRRLNCSKSTISYHLGDGQKDKAYARVRKQRDKGVRYEPNSWQKIENNEQRKVA
jgi:orotate phosphoribosyltransferase-like protein